MVYLQFFGRFSENKIKIPIDFDEEIPTYFNLMDTPVKHAESRHEKEILLELKKKIPPHKRKRTPLKPEKSNFFL